MADIAPPQWDAPEFQAMRDTIMAHFGCNEQEAIVRLQALWDIPGNLEPPVPPPPPEVPDDLPDEVPQPPTRKKTVFTDFDLDSTIPERLPFFPAPYATEKIKAMEYVELWYFTAEGVLDASKITPTIADNTFGLQWTDNGFALHQVKASRNVSVDEDLSWEQILTARHNLLDAASGWPVKHRTVLAEFFMNLEALKATGSNPRALILYQATSRRLWHASLKGTGILFNLASISDSLLLKLENQIRDKDHEEIQKQASRSRPLSI